MASYFTFRQRSPRFFPALTGAVHFLDSSFVPFIVKERALGRTLPCLSLLIPPGQFAAYGEWSSGLHCT